MQRLQRERSPGRRDPEPGQVLPVPPRGVRTGYLFPLEVCALGVFTMVAGAETRPSNRPPPPPPRISLSLSPTITQMVNKTQGPDGGIWPQLLETSRPVPAFAVKTLADRGGGLRTSMLSEVRFRRLLPVAFLKVYAPSPVATVWISIGSFRSSYKWVSINSLIQRYAVSAHCPVCPVAQLISLFSFYLDVISLYRDICRISKQSPKVG